MEPRPPTGRHVQWLPVRTGFRRGFSVGVTQPSRTVLNDWPPCDDHPSAIAVKLHERTINIPKLQSANPMTTG